ncbi:MAG TPA: hypothetical protein DCM28_18255 [Phycisphaerales bacterium]|nr:hypothetical protein [Phycisphaerales bacterium]|tara:strand:+ start:1687 stop:2172 length:486 start_codon:yes stop_codon:yes gene_type:complete
MRQNTIQCSQFTQGYFQLLIDKTPQDLWFKRPAGVANHVAWQIGHVTVSANNGLKAIGQPSLCDESWDVLYLRGTESVDDASRYQSPDQIVAKYQQVYAALTQAFANADESVLLGDTQIERLVSRFPKQGDFLVFLLTSHLAMHAGQFSTLRKLLGLGHVM